MESRPFYPRHQGIHLAELAEAIGAELSDTQAADRPIRSVAPVSRAKADDVCYLLTRRHAEELQATQAGALICDAAVAKLAPAHLPVLLTSKPHTAFALAGALLHPQALRPEAVAPESGISPQAFVHPTAELEEGVEIEPFAVIGAGAQIGSGTRIGPNVVIGANVAIGRNCTIAAGATIATALIGNHVIIHPGVRIGQDGFGYAPGVRPGMIKIVQVGRVIIQDHVEIGANTTIDRGTMDDTVIGEGTKIDNLVQIGHNVRIGRHCGVVAQVGIAGSAIIGNGVMIGGNAGINGHITIGDGVQIGAKSGVIASIAPGERVAGVPARPIKDFLREIAEITSRTRNKQRKSGAKDE
ncbi:UDP-3-O-(3-hydroxymyristoyl)glucosamine N-acyltransferase [Xaviernesmea oryzae]|uniref:UDP-3-O-acylglucosamine N-acyltransferase n=1 Tax=Xaviernesmea oryzae TaxID=464029 RepID=A0A1Q9AX42_9HYPH|nr:UDP-3-O-(3-hydroxymyristoyl)glucosamine N-acyltransferase [Xaviernesmea oryzae]OLP60017.1 UDP-3-O-(3-hydroxymyristoyl)glucosamine N-acyltransferase [Xaviernesmea oryzae]SEK40056.1 UDP-3-O-[3-hydroxymyristoyl] glucosamine N-acyltransferase [Xaviernesmea oryzae]